MKGGGVKGGGVQGILLVDKAARSTSFHLVSLLRRITGEQTIGHAGTLDPFATGVMVMLLGKPFTKRAAEFLALEKEYKAVIRLGVATNTLDLEGEVTSRSDVVPTPVQVEQALVCFQGDVVQIPPMFSAKKVGGKKLYDLARRGITIERQPIRVHLALQLLRYEYPELEIFARCSKGAYMRTLADDLGKHLGCGGHLIALRRTRVGAFVLDECIPQSFLSDLQNPPPEGGESSQNNLTAHLRML